MFYSVGFKRSKNDTVLDVTYPVILSDQQLLSELKKMLSITSSGAHALHRMIILFVGTWPFLICRIINSDRYLKTIHFIFLWTVLNVDTIHRRCLF